MHVSTCGRKGSWNSGHLTQDEVVPKLNQYQRLHLLQHQLVYPSHRRHSLIPMAETKPVFAQGAKCNVPLQSSERKMRHKM